MTGKRMCMCASLLNTWRPAATAAAAAVVERMRKESRSHLVYGHSSFRNGDPDPFH